MSEKSINKINVFGNAINVAFNLVWPIGVTYPQYPGEKSPMDLWGEFSTWEPINYNGAFFRAAGGNANPWIEVTTADGKNFTIKEGRSVPVNSALKSGATVMFNGESKTVSYVNPSGSNITSFTINGAFTQPAGGYKDITNVYILQGQQTELPNHNHDLNGSVWRTGSASLSGGVWASNNGKHSHGITWSNGKGLNALSVDAGSATGVALGAGAGMGVSIGETGISIEYNLKVDDTIGITHNFSIGDRSINRETRPANATLIVWRRTA